ncbi:Uncharacterised protein [Yersinia bercovieri]|nr:Uncharacterised protein [Yersinia bercovieri]
MGTYLRLESMAQLTKNHTQTSYNQRNNNKISA